jgi:hypothetical protein
MMQAIATKWLGPTDTQGSRVVARCQAKRIVVGWDHALDVGPNHAAAAQALFARLGWRGVLHGGALPDGTGYCFVIVDTYKLAELTSALRDRDQADIASL